MHEKHLLQVLYGMSVDLLGAVDPDGTIVMASPSWTTSLGFSQSELIGRKFLDLLHPEDLASSQEQMERLLQGHKTLQFQNRYVTKDGSVRWMEWNAELSAEDGVIFTVGRDITNRRRQAHELSDAANRFRAVIDTSFDGIVLIDPRGIVQMMNPAAERMFGYAAHEVIGHNVSILMPEPDRSRHDGYLGRYRSTKERRIIGRGREVYAQRKDGSLFPMELAVNEIEREGHRGFVGFIRDITELKQYQEQLRAFAFKDQVTGLHNRRLFEHDLQGLFLQARRNDIVVGLIFLDINDFKTINDTHGHDVGDEVLKIVSGRLRGAFRQSDVIARLGGDEFVVLATGGLDDVILRRLVAALEQPMSTSRGVFQCRYGIGYASAPRDGARSADELLRQADTAMYASKRQGKQNMTTVVTSYNDLQPGPVRAR